MSWKSLLSAGFAACFLSTSVWAAPSIVAVPSQTVNASGNREWTIRVIPDATAGGLPSSLAVELPFTHTAGALTRPVGIVDNAATQTNSSQANDTAAKNDSWYYNETVKGSGTILWNTTDPANVADTTQNTGFNPFTTSVTEGLTTQGGVNAFAALGSTIFPTGTTSVDTLHLVTTSGGGILHLGAAVVGQKDPAGPLSINYSIPAQDFYVTADYDGDGKVGPADLSLLLFAFGKNYTTQPAWDGNKPVAASGIVGPADLSNLLFNFNAGVGFGAGSGSSVPEPTSALLVVVGGILALAGRRSRRS